MDDKKQCKDCLGEIPVRAKKCVHCGSKVKIEWKHMTLAEKIASFGCLTILIIFIFSLFSANDSSSPKRMGIPDYENVAAICAQNKVKSMLKSPSTAEFPWDLKASKLEDGSFAVANYVDAQNTFGAIIRSNYLCTVKVINAENSQCESECILQ